MICLEVVNKSVKLKKKESLIIKLGVKMALKERKVTLLVTGKEGK